MPLFKTIFAHGAPKRFMHSASLVIIVEDDLQFFANVKERLLKNLPKNNTLLATSLPSP